MLPKRVLVYFLALEITFFAFGTKGDNSDICENPGIIWNDEMSLMNHEF